MELKHHLKEFHPNCEVFFSCPIIRTDHRAARITINNLRNKFNANVTSCRQEVSLLNHNAKIFSPNYLNALTKIALSSSRALETCVITALFATFLTLVILLLYNLGIIGDMVKTCDMLPKNVLSKLKRDHPNNIVIGHLNINSIREKFECLKDIIGTGIDMLLISETKLNDNFPQGQFVINGFRAPFREDRIYIFLNQ